MSDKSHTLISKTPSGKCIPSSNLFSDPNDSSIKVIKDIVQELLFTLITEGIQNEKGNYIYERHELTWELKTGDKNLSLKESLKNEFIKKLQEININALVSVKIYPDKLDVWVIFNDNTSLETDLQVNRIFRQLEKQHSSINMSLYMASKDELNDDNVTSF